MPPTLPPVSTPPAGPPNDPASRPLRYGWTTGACATAAAKAAYTALLTGEFPDPVQIHLPKGQRPYFALAREQHPTPLAFPAPDPSASNPSGPDAPGSGGAASSAIGPGGLSSGEAGPDALASNLAEPVVQGSGERPGAVRTAMAGVIKDAGDDPDVTHGALVMATVWLGMPGSGVTFRAGRGVGTITKPGLPLEVGEPAINPMPRKMMREHIAEVAAQYGDAGDVVIEISIENGEELARRTWNPRLGILGGLSVLGTTGVVVPYSCSAWIDSIRRGIDVARAAGHTHVAGCTGSTSELVAKDLYGLPDDALLDMGDFAGAVLKYLRRHPVPRLTIAGGVGKLAKLADGHLDLHSSRSQVNKEFLATLAIEAGATDTLAAEIRTANTALAALHLSQAAGIPLADTIAVHARRTAEHVLREAPVTVDVVVIDRAGTIVGRA